MDCLPTPTPRASALETAKTCHKTPALISYRVRCGKPACRCTRGDLHGPYWFLRWRDGGQHRRRYVRAADLPAVRAIIERRQAAERTERLERVRALVLLRGLRRWLREIERDPSR